jgi:RecA-family ATPase
VSFRILDYKALQALEDPEWLVDGVIPTGVGGSRGMLFGKWGSGKSFVALDLAHCVATGLDWHGRPTQKGRVAYVAAEGAFGLKRRASAWAKQYGFLGAVPRIHYVMDGVNLMSLPHVERLLDTLQEDTPGLPDLVVIDTLANSMPGGDENEAKDINTMMEGVGRIQAVTRGAVMLVHHQGYSEDTRARGSSSLPGHMDFILGAEKTGNKIALKCHKQKDAEDFATMHFTLKPLAGSCVLERASNVVSMRVR